MENDKPQPHLIIPELCIPKGEMNENICIGHGQPFAFEVMKPLFDIGLRNALITRRKTFKYLDGYKHNKKITCHLFCVSIEGEMEYGCDEYKLTLKPGEMFLCPRNTIKRYTCIDNSWFICF